MKKTKKIIVLVMACVMLFGATLTVNAANCNWTSTSGSVNHCGSSFRPVEKCITSGHNHYRCGSCHVEL